MIFLISSLSFVCIICAFVIFNLLKKVEKYEDAVLKQEQILASYLEYMNGLSKIIEHSADRLQKIDDKGTFRSDDEIGWFFEEVITIQSRLNNFKLINFEDNNAKTKE